MLKQEISLSMTARFLTGARQRYGMAIPRKPIHICGPRY
jgi:hypothetical protein